MDKGFGIAGLVLAILSVFAAYGFNFAVIWLAMVCCAVAALNGDRTYTIASILIAGVGLLVLSPVTIAAISNASNQGDSSLLFVAFLPFTLPIVALIISSVRSPKTGELKNTEMGEPQTAVVSGPQPMKASTLIGSMVAALLIVVVIIVLLLAIGGYFWFSSQTGS